jgi:hypothetical protein
MIQIILLSPLAAESLLPPALSSRWRTLTASFSSPENITGDNGGQDIGYLYGTGGQKKEQQSQKKIPTLHTTSVSGGDTLPAHAHNNKKKSKHL